MKVATEIPIKAPPETIWKILLDFPAYEEWNRFIKSARGEATADARVEMHMHYVGEDLRKLTGQVTGLIIPKYLSWAWTHSLGSWFMVAEHVFRIKEHEDGKVTFHQEAYYTGLGLKFRRSTIERSARLSMDKMNEDLKERVESSGGVTAS